SLYVQREEPPDGERTRGRREPAARGGGGDRRIQRGFARSGACLNVRHKRYGWQHCHAERSNAASRKREFAPRPKAGWIGRSVVLAGGSAGACASFGMRFSAVAGTLCALRAKPDTRSRS